MKKKYNRPTMQTIDFVTCNMLAHSPYSIDSNEFEFNGNASDWDIQEADINDNGLWELW